MHLNVTYETEAPDFTASYCFLYDLDTTLQGGISVFRATGALHSCDYCFLVLRSL